MGLKALKACSSSACYIPEAFALLLLRIPDSPHVSLSCSGIREWGTQPAQHFFLTPTTPTFAEKNAKLMDEEFRLSNLDGDFFDNLKLQAIQFERICVRKFVYVWVSNRRNS